VVEHPDWQGTPLRIAHLTDLHVHSALPLEYYQGVVAATEDAKPDIVVFTGDFITSVDALPKLAKVLRPVGRLATYAVLGNHDYWADADGVRQVIRGCGLDLLTDESRVLSIDGREVLVSGYDHPWGAQEQVMAANAGEVLHIALSHTPDNIYRLSKSSADLVFSGHYHAGQIRAPFMGSIIVPSVYGRRFDHGHFVVNGTHLFVASGIGAASPPFRIYCQPDIFVVDVMSKGEG
jgi:predicted MPP superfamily phosphohydrolase